MRLLRCDGEFWLSAQSWISWKESVRERLSQSGGSMGVLWGIVWRPVIEVGEPVYCGWYHPLDKRSWPVWVEKAGKLRTSTRTSILSLLLVMAVSVSSFLFLAFPIMTDWNLEPRAKINLSTLLSFETYYHKIEMKLRQQKNQFG